MSGLLQHLSLRGGKRDSLGFNLPFGRTQDLSPRNRTIAMRGFEPSVRTIPPAAKIGARIFVESAMPKLAEPSRIEQARKRSQPARADGGNPSGRMLAVGRMLGAEPDGEAVPRIDHRDGSATSSSSENTPRAVS